MASSTLNDIVNNRIVDGSYGVYVRAHAWPSCAHGMALPVAVRSRAAFATTATPTAPRRIAADRRAWQAAGGGADAHCADISLFPPRFQTTFILEGGTDPGSNGMSYLWHAAILAAKP
eukprot:358671-Chlamydomonas_euryale.AAC.7